MISNHRIKERHGDIKQVSTRQWSVGETELCCEEDIGVNQNFVH